MGSGDDRIGGGTRRWVRGDGSADDHPGDVWGSIGNREAHFEGKIEVRIFRLLFKDRNHDDSTSESGGHRGDYGVSGADLEDFV